MLWKIVPLAFGFSGGHVCAMMRNAYLEYPALVVYVSDRQDVHEQGAEVS